MRSDLIGKFVTFIYIIFLSIKHERIIMAVKSIDLAWITVSDVEKTKKFFTDVIGLKLTTDSKEFGWCELSGAQGGCMLGIAQAQEDPQADKPGHNAVITLTVDDLIKTKAEFQAHGVQFLGDIIEIPGHVKMALFTDLDGNKFQIVELLS